ncbi:hypothetical protein C0Q70_12610 [Pomacea canaliculata]|uniref:Tetraspanin n=1 Tax=Pomacea canaliculata TaxID=400727 RepID=A0A2T7P209_POMCA|nr:hypothetical protein C0Q70_12610 [Pomacea canaliculata]
MEHYWGYRTLDVSKVTVHVDTLLEVNTACLSLTLRVNATSAAGFMLMTREVFLSSSLSLIGLALLACGAVIKYFLGQVLKSDIFDKVLETAFKIFVPNNEAPKTIEFGPLTDGVGIALMVLGCLVLVISLIGICAACCGFKVLLILFMICVGVLVIAQIIVASVFLPRNSKDNLINKLSTDYDRQHINSFTISSDVLFMADQTHTYVTPLVPPSCCKRQYLERLDWTCSKNYAMSYDQGCYEKLQDLLEEWYPWLIPAIVISILVQVGVIGVAVLVYVDKGNAII